MKSNKKLIIALVAIVAVIAIVACAFVFTRPQTQAGAKAFTVEVVHSDGASKSFSYRTDEEYLGAALVANGLIAGEDGPYGMMVLTVDGEDAIYEQSGAYWAFYVGGEYAMTGVDSTPVTDGASYSLVYTVG